MPSTMYLEYQRLFGHDLLHLETVVPFLLPTNDAVAQKDGILQTYNELKKRSCLFLSMLYPNHAVAVVLLLDEQ